MVGKDSCFTVWEGEEGTVFDMNPRSHVSRQECGEQAAVQLLEVQKDLVSLHGDSLGLGISQKSAILWMSVTLLMVVTKYLTRCGLKEGVVCLVHGLGRYKPVMARKAL